MESWEKATLKFLQKWKNKKEVIGALVCGSYVTGNPSSHSDIDLHIILSPGANWRERGNCFVDGFLIEYFANTPHQIHEYFQEDYAKGSQMSMVQFATGKILFDDGHVKKLQKTAHKLIQKPFKKKPKLVIELQKYALWDKLDNIQDAYENKRKDFTFLYHIYINELMQIYSKFVGYPRLRDQKALQILESSTARKKYLLKEFPDQRFSKILKQAIVETDKKKMLRHYEHLTQHTLNKMGGFKIDGWKIRSKSTISKKK